MGVKLSDLTLESSPASTDILLIADPVTGLARKITVSAFKTFIDGLGGGGDVAAPTVVSATASTASTIVVVFSESVTVTTAGWSFKKNGADWAITSVAGSGTTWTFTMSSSGTNSDTLLRSYNSTTGNTIDTASNELATFTNSAVTNSIPGSFDADAQAFFTATGITDDTQKNAIDALVVGLKADGLWTKMHAIYPFVGGTASTHKYNLKNPADTDAAYRLIFAGTVTHNANGITPNGTTGYADTKFNPSNTGHLASLGSSSLGFYSKTQNNGGGGAGTFANIGAYNDSAGTKAFWIASAWAADLVQSQIGTSVVLNTTDADTQAFFVATRRSTTDAELYLDGTSANTNVSTETLTAPNLTVFIGALNYNGGASFFAPHNLAFAFIGDGITDGEVTNLNTRVVTFQTALGRQN